MSTPVTGQSTSKARVIAPKTLEDIWAAQRAKNRRVSQLMHFYSAEEARRG